MLKKILVILAVLLVFANECFALEGRKIANVGAEMLYTRILQTCVNNGISQNVTSKTVDVPFTSSGTIKASATDGTNTVNSSYTVTINHTVNYYCSTNGGSGDTTASVNEGSSIDLSKTCDKSGWNFLGWNTDSNAKSGITSKSMGNENVNLYGIYSKDITVNFVINDTNAVSNKNTSPTNRIISTFNR